MQFRDRVIRFLIEELKAEELDSPSKTHRKFYLKRIDKIYWIGNRRSVRTGPSMSASCSATIGIKERMEKWEKKLLSKN